jgi:hypothetical protein
MMMRAILSSETSVVTRAKWRNIPEDGIFHRHRREDLTFCNVRNIDTRLLSSVGRVYSTLNYGRTTSFQFLSSSLLAAFPQSFHAVSIALSDRQILQNERLANKPESELRCDQMELQSVGECC